MNQKERIWKPKEWFCISIVILEQTKGSYFISETTDDSKGRPKDDEKKYPVKMKHNKIIPTKPIPNDKLKRNRKL